MKQQIISGLKKKLLLVELPEGAHNIHLFHDIGRPYISYFVNHETGRLYLEKDVELICKITDITESQCEEFVEWVDVPQYYKDYRKDGWQGDITAQESFFSALEANRVYFENKLGEYPTKQNTGLEYGMEYISKVASWEEVQDGVWDKDRTWCFEVIS